MAGPAAIVQAVPVQIVQLRTPPQRQPVDMNPKKPLPPKAEMPSVIIMANGLVHIATVMMVIREAIVPRIIRMIVAGMEIGCHG